MRINNSAVLGRFGPKSSVACPFFGHSCFDFKCFAHFGTTNILPPGWLHPLKTAKHLKSKQESLFFGPPTKCIDYDGCPNLGKTFFRKIRMPEKGTIVICQNVNNI